MLTRRQGWSHFLFQMVMSCFFQKKVISSDTHHTHHHHCHHYLCDRHRHQHSHHHFCSIVIIIKDLQANFVSKCGSSLIITEYILTDLNLEKDDFQTLHAKMMQNPLVYVNVRNTTKARLDGRALL